MKPELQKSLDKWPWVIPAAAGKTLSEIVGAQMEVTSTMNTAFDILCCSLDAKSLPPEGQAALASLQKGINHSMLAGAALQTNLFLLRRDALQEGFLAASPELA